MFQNERDQDTNEKSQDKLLVSHVDGVRGSKPGERLEKVIFKSDGRIRKQGSATRMQIVRDLVPK